MPATMDVQVDFPIKDGAEEGSNDIRNTLAAFDEITTASDKLSDSINNLFSKEEDFLKADEGLSILTIKNHLLMQYLTNLVFTILNKCGGKSIQNDPAIERLVEIRTVIERIRPLEQKLKYQIDKLVKIALTGAPSKNDGTQFRADPMSLMNESEESDEDEDLRPRRLDTAANSSRNVGEKYVPPRLAAMRYDGEETLASKQKDLVEKAKKQALSSSIVQKMQEEYLDAPIEIAHASGLKNTISKEERERTEYEEANYTRLPRTKRDKILAKQRAALTSSSFGDELTKFDDFQSLDQELNKLSKKRKKSFRSSSGKNKKKLSFKKKKRFHK